MSRSNTPFGISSIRIGAILVHNFRIRCKYGSDLYLHLRNLATLIQNFNVNKASVAQCSSKGDCVIFDFSMVDSSSHDYNFFRDTVVMDVRKAIFRAEVEKLNERFKELPIVAVIADRCIEECEPVAADYWNDDGAEL